MCGTPLNVTGDPLQASSSSLRFVEVIYHLGESGGELSEYLASKEGQGSHQLAPRRKASERVWGTTLQPTQFHPGTCEPLEATGAYSPLKIGANSQQVRGPDEVYCPRESSRKKMGIPTKANIMT